MPKLNIETKKIPHVSLHVPQNNIKISTLEKYTASNVFYHKKMQRNAITTHIISNYPIFMK
jgi:hypothetical protein